MASIQFGPADRDEHGFVRVHPEPRSLADLLPPVHAAPPAPAIQRRPPTRQEIASILAVLALVGFIAYFTTRGGEAPAAAPPAPATAPAVSPASGDGAAQPSPLPAPPPAVKRPAYAAPDGQQLGEIETTRQITPVAHFGDAWIQADVQGSGRIWLRASDWPELAIVGPDLTPRRPAPAPVAAPPEPPPPPPAPTQCAAVGVPGKMVSACGLDDLGVLQSQAQQQWLATYGGNVGVIDHPTPQPIGGMP